MPEFPLPAGGSVIRTYGSVPASTNGTTLAAGAPGNTKGSYVELISATEFDANWIQIQFGASSINFSSLLDIAIGAAPEQVVIPDLYYGPGAVAGDGPSYLFPMFIPKGSRLTSRFQSSTASATMDVVVRLTSGMMLNGHIGQSNVVRYGSGAFGSIGQNVDPGGTANTDSAWSQITAATVRDHHWWAIGGRCGDGSLSAATRWLIDIGIGAATEQVVVSDIFATEQSGIGRSYGGIQCFPMFVPAGSRLTMRAMSSSTTDGDRDVNMFLHGC